MISLLLSLTFDTLSHMQVTGMQAGATFSMSETNGTLTLHVEECGTYIENLEITLHGGASWLYQWRVSDASL